MLISGINPPQKTVLAALETRKRPSLCSWYHSSIISEDSRDSLTFSNHPKLGRAKRICYLSPMRAAKVQASLRIRAVSPEPSLLAHTNSDSRGTLRQKPRSLAPLNGWACAVKVCHDGMLEDTNSLGAAHLKSFNLFL